MTFNAVNDRDIEQNPWVSGWLSLTWVKDDTSRQMLETFLQDYGKLSATSKKSLEGMSDSDLDKETGDKKLVALREQAKTIMKDRVEKRYIPSNRVANPEWQPLNAIQAILQNLQYSTTAQDQEKEAMIARLQARLDEQSKVIEDVATQRTTREYLWVVGKQRKLQLDLQSIEEQVRGKEEKVGTEQRGKVLHYCCKKVAPDIFYTKNPLSDRIRRGVLAKWPNTAYSPQDLQGLEASIATYQQATSSSPVRAARAQIIGQKIKAIISNYRQAKIRELEQEKWQRAVAP